MRSEEEVKAFLNVLEQQLTSNRKETDDYMNNKGGVVADMIHMHFVHVSVNIQSQISAVKFILNDNTDLKYISKTN